MDEQESQTTHFEAFVQGTPKPQGSKRAFRTTNGRINLTEQVKGLEAWRQDVKAVALAKWNAPPAPKHIPVDIELYFHLLKPASAKRIWPVVRPDLDKLTRAVCDALTGLVYIDDSQIVSIIATKMYADTQGVHIKVWPHQG